MHLRLTSTVGGGCLFCFRLLLSLLLENNSFYRPALFAIESIQAASSAFEDLKVLTVFCAFSCMFAVQLNREL